MLHIAAQNLKGALSDPERAEALFESIDQQPEAERPDVVFYGEAFDLNVNRTYGGFERQGIERRFARLGYDSLRFAYNDTDKRHDQNGGWMAVKLDVCNGWVKGRYIDLSRRMGALTMVKDPETHEIVWVMGVHLDDRSRANRHAMVDAMGWNLWDVDEKAGGRIALAGVLNSTEQDDPHAEGLRRLGRYRESRLVRALWDTVAATPGEQPERGLRRKLSLAARAIDMTTDGVADRLREMGLVSVDPDHTPTVEGGGHRLRLDDIRYSAATLAVVEQGVELPAAGVASGKDNHLKAGAMVWAKLRVGG